MITLLLIELVHLPVFLKTSKATRFTVGFRIFDHMKLFDFANTWRLVTYVVRDVIDYLYFVLV